MAVDNGNNEYFKTYNNKSILGNENFIKCIYGY